MTLETGRKDSSLIEVWAPHSIARSLEYKHYEYVVNEGEERTPKGHRYFKYVLRNIEEE